MPDRHPLPLRDRLRPDPEVWEIVRHPADELDVADMRLWVERADRNDAAWVLGALGVVAAQSTWRAGRRSPRGGETAVNWAMPVELVAAQIGATALSERPPLAPLFDAAEHPWRSEALGVPIGPELLLIAADLHIHSAWSHDSVAPIREILLAAERAGLDAIAITDHERLSYDEVVAVEADMRMRGELSRPLLLIPGVEVSTSAGHVLAYFVRAMVPHAMDPAATLSAIHRQGGMAVLAHPYRPGSGIHGPLAERLPWDGAELISGADLYPTSWVRALDRGGGFGSARLGSSDAHFSAWVGSAVTILAVTEVTITGVHDAMRVGRTWPVARNRAVDAWAGALGQPALRGALRAVNGPMAASEWLRLQGARLVGADDLRVWSTWSSAFGAAWSIWGVPELLRRIRDPWDPLRLPPLPGGVALRWGPVVASLETPVAVWVRDSAGRPLQLPPEPLARPSGLDAGSPAVFVWPGEWLTMLHWEWIF